MRDQPYSLKFSLAFHRQAHTVAAEKHTQKMITVEYLSTF